MDPPPKEARTSSHEENLDVGVGMSGRSSTIEIRGFKRVAVRTSSKISLDFWIFEHSCTHRIRLGLPLHTSPNQVDVGMGHRLREKLLAVVTPKLLPVLGEIGDNVAAFSFDCERPRLHIVTAFCLVMCMLYSRADHLYINLAFSLFNG